tara:strand:- start:6118 stop:6885 length:768 start_codon:yes stop_codon:yes gene_type:complete
MSKLIVDDIELASGELLGLPNTLENGKLLPISSNSIGAGEDIPAAKHQLLHDFSVGSQPTSLTYNFSTDSSNIIAIRIMFSQMRVTGSVENTDIAYGVGSSTLDVPAGHTNYQNRPIRYCYLSYEDQAGTGQGTGFGRSDNSYMYSMGGPRANTGMPINQSNPLDQCENSTHYVYFDKNSVGGYVFKQMGKTSKIVGSGNNMRHASYGSHFNYSATSNNTSDYPGHANPFTKIGFIIPSNVTVYQGQISIMEYLK